MAGVTPATCRAARGLIGMAQIELAHAARVSVSAVKGFEASRNRPNPSTLTAIENALVAAGVVFLAETDGEGAGVRLRKDPQADGTTTKQAGTADA